MTMPDQQQEMRNQQYNMANWPLQQLQAGRHLTCSPAIIMCSDVHASLGVPVLQIA
jgi:hypothetical protein